MGPFPHDAPPPESPTQPDGHRRLRVRRVLPPKADELDRLFKTMGFSAVAKHRAKQVTLYRQGDINFVLNAEPNSFAAKFADAHGPSAPAMAFRVVDARRPMTVRWRSARSRPDVSRAGRTQHSGDRGHWRPADLSGRPLWREGLDLRRRLRMAGRAQIRSRQVRGCYYIDHLTHNVHRGRIDEWADFYVRLFNFRQIRFFDIEGRSRACIRGR